MADSNRQKYLQNFQKPDLYSRKNENVQILFKGIWSRIYTNPVYKNRTICLILFKAFQRAEKKTKSNDRKWVLI